MTEPSDADRLHLDRRGFIRSLFGLTTAAEGKIAEAKTELGGHWFWSNIKAGHVGYPSGLTLKQNRPGSLMKLIAAAALHNKGLLNTNETVDCTGSKVTVGKETVACQFAHGKVSLVHALGVSCNVYFANVAHRLNGHTFIEYARKFGLDQPIAGRKSGPFPEKALDSSLPYVLGLAEDLQPNALQLMRVASIIATRGNVPYMHSAEDISEHPPFELELSDSTWNRLTEGMRYCVTHGTAKALDPENKLSIAAKTGTVFDGGQMYSWVLGFFPAEKPDHSFCVWSPSGTSHDAAVPFAKRVLLSNQWS